MLRRRINICLVFLVVMALTGFVFSYDSYAVPAAPVVHTLSQPDGSTFKARQWGDENINGWETEDGYSIVFDEKLDSWVYAVHEMDGKLISSSIIVGKDYPPNVSRHLRPSGKTQEAILLMKMERAAEIYKRVVPPTGTGTIPVILINYNDRTTTYTPAQFNTLLFGTGNYSVRDYYNEVSYGVFTVSAGPGGISGWYTSAQGHDYYGQDDASGEDRWFGTLVREAVAAADPTLNFAPYDQDGDCYVDVVAIIHQGEGEEASGDTTDIYTRRWNLNSAYYYGYSNGGEYTTNDACPGGGFIRVNDYTIQPETQWWGQISTIGAFTHEYGHALGLPDLYDTDYSSEGIGDWSLMAGGTWNGILRLGDRPAHLDAWSKYSLDWVTPTQVSGTLTNEPITQAATTADVYRLRSGSPLSGEYFLVENRQKTGFDTGLPGAGLLIWHIDGNTIASTINSNTVNDSECYPGGPSCAAQHYGVRLVQADNLWELEKNIDRGDDRDPYPGSTGNTSFTTSSSPNSNLYNGTASNVSITGISASGSLMTATLTVSGGETLFVSLTANPSSGTAPLNGVDLTATVSGTATGTINYTFYCNRSDSGTNITYPYDYKIDGTNQTTFTVYDVCNYSSAGTYTAKVIAERGSAPPAESRTTITISTPQGVLSVTPSDGLTSSGNQGGPFSPSSKTYTLSNAGGSSINWSASKGQAWVSLSSTSGTLAAGGNTTVTVSINSSATSLTPGTYSDTVSFTNTTNGNGNTIRPVSLIVNPTANVSKIGVFRNGAWYLDLNGNGGWDGCATDGCYAFGMSGDKAVVGNWNGIDGSIGVFRNGVWFLDWNGNDGWDGIAIDKAYNFGLSTDIPVAGDWDGDGFDEIGVFRNGTWYLDYNGNGAWDGCSVDKCYPFGMTGDMAVVGDWNGDGKTEIGVKRGTAWYLDYSGNGAWDGCTTDRCYTFGLSTDIPVAGDWDGDGFDKIGVFRNGGWYLDKDGSGSWSGCATDGCYTFGMTGDQPVAGKW